VLPAYKVWSAFFRAHNMRQSPQQSKKAQIGNMRVTVDIDEQSLREIQAATGERKKSAAVQKALHAYLRELRKRRLLARVLAGKTDYGMTNEELESANCVRRGD